MIVSQSKMYYSIKELFWSKGVMDWFYILMLIIYIGFIDLMGQIILQKEN